MKERLELFSFPFWDISPEELISGVLDFCKLEGFHTVNYLNPHACVLARKDEAFSQALHTSDLTWCDGQGIVLACRVLGITVQHRWTLPDQIDAIFTRLAKAGLSTFFIGEQEKDLFQFLETVRKKHPQLNVIGGHPGYFSLDSDEAERLIDRLQYEKPDVIFVGTGMPRQEILGMRMKARLHQGVAFSAGALFLYFAGLEKRCPSFFSRHGLEWFYRLVRNPRRYFRRYVIENTVFIWRVLLSAFRQRCAPS